VGVFLVGRRVQPTHTCSSWT